MRAWSCTIGLVLAGCASVPGRIVPEIPQDENVVTLQRPVKLVLGESLDCGAESLHAVFQYYQQGPRFEELVAALYVPGVEGTFPQKLIQVARQHGFATRTVEGSLDSLRSSIDAGIPCIILARLRRSSNHYLIPTAYSPAEGWFVCEFYHGAKWILSADELERAWRPCGHLQLEFFPDPVEAWLAQAQLAEENCNHTEALDLYRKVLANHPDRQDARVGAANCLALQGAFVEAQTEYLKVLDAGSRDPELLNNLADVSLSLGDDGDLVKTWASEAVHTYKEQREIARADLQRAVLGRKLALALGTLASIHLSRDELLSARDCFQRSLNLLPSEEAELRKRRLEQLAQCCERLGDEVSAAAYRREAK